MKRLYSQNPPRFLTRAFRLLAAETHELFFFTHPLTILKKYYFCIGFVFGKFRGGKDRCEVWK